MTHNPFCECEKCERAQQSELVQLQAEVVNLQARNDRLALLVRLLSRKAIRFMPDLGIKITSPPHDLLRCTYTKGIPDLTPDQWERLAKLLAERDAEIEHLRQERDFWKSQCDAIPSPKGDE
jgi:hypothetical protein